MSLGPTEQPQHLWLPPRLAYTVHNTCLRVGLLSVLAAVAIGVVLVPLAGHIPVAALVNGAGAVGVLLSGTYLITTRTCVRGGALNITRARQARHSLLGMGIYTLVFTVLGYLFRILPLTPPGTPTAALALGLLLPIPMLALVTVNYVAVGCRLLPPSQTLLHSYGASGQVAGPQIGLMGTMGQSPGAPPQGQPPGWGPQQQ